MTKIKKFQDFLINIDLTESKIKKNLNKFDTLTNNKNKNDK